MIAIRRAGSPPDPAAPPARAILRLIELVVLGRWRSDRRAVVSRGGARIIEAQAGQDVLVSGCGDGLTVEWLAERTRASVTGVDPDAKQIERAEARLRGASLIENGYAAGVIPAGRRSTIYPHETACSTLSSASRRSRGPATRRARLRSWCG